MVGEQELRWDHMRCPGEAKPRHAILLGHHVVTIMCLFTCHRVLGMSARTFAIRDAEASEMDFRDGACQAT